MWSLLTYFVGSNQENNSNNLEEKTPLLNNVETINPTRKYLLKRDVHDCRDLYVKFFQRVNDKLPEKVDLRLLCPPVYDQGQLGSCTANAIGAAYHFDELKQNQDKKSVFLPSRLFLYYNERKLEGTVDQDSGASIRDGFISMATDGMVDELKWPYDITKFADKPPTSIYDEAKLHRSTKYYRISDSSPDHLKTILSNGCPFAFGIAVYESFESKETASSGVVVLPDTTKEKLLGGHALLCVGYDDEKKSYIVRNSWSESWGDKGYCYIPYDYLANMNLAYDFWYLENIAEFNSNKKIRKVMKV